MLSTHCKQLIPFLMAGYPDFPKFKLLVESMIGEGIQTFEIGIPYSDPVADGPIIQKAAAQALQQKLSLIDIFSSISELRNKFPQVNFIIFTYFNPIYQFGVPNYVKSLKHYGIAGSLVVDLPVDESEEYNKYKSMMDEANIKTVCLASPTTSDERLRSIAKASTGFVYYISRLGVTGTMSSLSQTLVSEIIHLKKVISSSTPLAVGFGISTPEHVMAVSRHADGVVIGSKYLALIDQSDSLERMKETVGEFTRQCLLALEQSSLRGF